MTEPGGGRVIKLNCQTEDRIKCYRTLLRIAIDCSTWPKVVEESSIPLFDLAKMLQPMEPISLENYIRLQLYLEKQFPSMLPPIETLEKAYAKLRKEVRPYD